jgi:hypothetical protein
VKHFLLFLVHQVISTWGVAGFAYFLTSSIFELSATLGKPLSTRSLHWILTETPYFPIQIAIGFCFGWQLWRRFNLRLMAWVWVLPFLILCYGILAGPISSPEFTSVLFQAGPKQSWLSHYFGSGCRPVDHCFDQLVITMPFYASASYSLGALLARRTNRPIRSQIAPSTLN